MTGNSGDVILICEKRRNSEVGHRLWVWHPLGLSRRRSTVFGRLLGGARRDGADEEGGTGLLPMKSCA